MSNNDDWLPPLLLTILGFIAIPAAVFPLLNLYKDNIAATLLIIVIAVAGEIRLAIYFSSLMSNH